MPHRKHRQAKSEAEPWRQPLPPELDRDPRLLTREQHEEVLRWFRRRLMNCYELYNACPDAGCRRAHRCAQPDVPCYELARPFIREKIFPQLMPEIERRAAAWRAAHDADKPPESSL